MLSPNFKGAYTHKTVGSCGYLFCLLHFRTYLIFLIKIKVYNSLEKCVVTIPFDYISFSKGDFKAFFISISLCLCCWKTLSSLGWKKTITPLIKKRDIKLRFLSSNRNQWFDWHGFQLTEFEFLSFWSRLTSLMNGILTDASSNVFSSVFSIKIKF